MFSMKEFRDFDLMAKLRDTGPISSRDLAREIAGDEEGRHLGKRLGWMRRYGMLGRDDDGLWLLTAGGERVVKARARAALIRELNDLPEHELIEVMAAVTARWRVGTPMVADMLRREFVFGTQR